jgi:hypothetical protein
MREIIIKSSGPRLIFSDAGRLKLLRTGSDSFAEHNDATEQLARKVCPLFLEVQPTTERFRIAKTESVHFVMLPVVDGGPVEAVLGVNTPGGWFTPSETQPLDHASVLYSLKTFHDDVAAALAWGNFAIRVRGADKVEALAQFYESVLAGDVAVAPSERNHYQCQGVALVDLKELSRDERFELNRNSDTFLEAIFGR